MAAIIGAGAPTSQPPRPAWEGSDDLGERTSVAAGRQASRYAATSRAPAIAPARAVHRARSPAVQRLRAFQQCEDVFRARVTLGSRCTRGVHG